MKCWDVLKTTMRERAAYLTKILTLWTKCTSFFMKQYYAVIAYHFKGSYPTTRGRENPLHVNVFDSFRKRKPSLMHITQPFQNPTRANGFPSPPKLSVISRNVHWCPHAWSGVQEGSFPSTPPALLPQLVRCSHPTSYHGTISHFPPACQI